MIFKNFFTFFIVIIFLVFFAIFDATINEVSMKHLQVEANVTQKIPSWKTSKFRIRTLRFAGGAQILRMKRRKRQTRNRRKQHRKGKHGPSLWIDQNQVLKLTGYNIEIYAIFDGMVMPQFLNPDFHDQLPVIPSDLEHVNITWKSPRRKYHYNFHVLTSYNQSILDHPRLSIKKKGRVPKRPETFTIHMECAKNVSGVASFDIGLKLRNNKEPLPDTPLRLRLRKNCVLPGVANSTCSQRCTNGGICDIDGGCSCPMGYMGQYCTVALCYPQCQNGGTCAYPGRCTCPVGYHGRICEGGICRRKCQNGGKCVQKDTCACRRGNYGHRCEFSKCIIPCVNGGSCRGVNKCRCKSGFSGRHCEIMTRKVLSKVYSQCVNRCRQGNCITNGLCRCNSGFNGKWCRKRDRRDRKKKFGSKHKKILV